MRIFATNKNAVFRRNVKGIVESLEKLTEAQDAGEEIKKGDTYMLSASPLSVNFSI